MTNMRNFVSTLCSSIMPGPDEPYRSLKIIAVTCWHTVNGSMQSIVSGVGSPVGPLQSFASGVGSPVGPSGICYTFCAQCSSVALG